MFLIDIQFSKPWFSSDCQTLVSWRCSVVIRADTIVFLWIYKTFMYLNIHLSETEWLVVLQWVRTVDRKNTQWTKYELLDQINCVVFSAYHLTISYPWPLKDTYHHLGWGLCWKDALQSSRRKACQKTRWKPRTRTYSRSWTTSENLCNRKTNLFFMHRARISSHKDTHGKHWKTSLEDSTYFPCYQSAVWSGKCRVWSVEWRV